MQAASAVDSGTAVQEKVDTIPAVRSAQLNKLLALGVHLRHIHGKNYWTLSVILALGSLNSILPKCSQYTLDRVIAFSKDTKSKLLDWSLRGAYPEDTNRFGHLATESAILN